MKICQHQTALENVAMEQEVAYTQQRCRMRSKQSTCKANATALSCTVICSAVVYTRLSVAEQLKWCSQFEGPAPRRGRLDLVGAVW